MALPKKILVANRGEIALRVMRSCREMGIETVAVYSEVDRSTPHVRYADQAYCIGAAPSSESYLVMERLMEVANKSGSDAIHPGYGFLSENATFAKMVEDAGLVWIGPPTKAIEIMGSKTASRQKMVKAGVPVVPGVTEAIDSIPEALEIADGIGYPVMLKAAAGGGGKGMREVNFKEDLAELFQRAQSEAINAFGNGDIYMEKRVINPRHVEIQIMADKHGNVVHLFERDCSIQRRHQKVVEESPCTALLPETREQMAAVAVLAAKSVDYVGAGTVEFLLSEDQSFYFLEMNTRLQVEHPITEMVTGIDLVQAQIRVAAGEVLAFAQEDIRQQGHAIECRIYAEDAQNNWAPSPGVLRGYQEPSGPWVRVDSGVKEGDEVTIFYDPMISKLIVWGQDREDALRRMSRALSEYRIRGIETTIPFFKSLLEDPDFIEGKYDTGFLSPERMDSLIPKNNYQEIAELAAVIYAFNRDQKMQSPVQQGQTTSKWKWSFR
jgi:acetyl-CoA carboxylase biotin carboxylase subunit